MFILLEKDPVSVSGVKGGLKGKERWPLPTNLIVSNIIKIYTTTYTW